MKGRSIVVYVGWHRIVDYYFGRDGRVHIMCLMQGVISAPGYRPDRQGD